MGVVNYLGAYFRRGQVSLDEIRGRLWNDAIDGSNYADAVREYQAAIMDQYKLYVEMTDRIAARRAATNTFFLLVNSGIFAAIGSLTRNPSPVASAILTLAVAMLLVQCGAWYWILRSYRQLSSAKFRVIGALEERLPAKPWFRAEWPAIGAGMDKSKYWPITQLEQWVPGIFAFAYIVLLIILLAA